jgi:hypothetical protein
MFSNGVPDDATFARTIQESFGNSTTIKEKILSKFPLVKTGAKASKAEQKNRFGAYMGQAVFSCYTRLVTEAYKGKVYNIQFDHGTGGHGTDLMALFPGEGYFSPLSIMYGSTKVGPPTFTPQYRSYFISHARTGDPNTLRDKATIEWPMVQQGAVFSNVLNAGNETFTLIDDKTNTAANCDWWQHIYVEATKGNNV